MQSRQGFPSFLLLVAALLAAATMSHAFLLLPSPSTSSSRSATTTMTRMQAEKGMTERRVFLQNALGVSALLLGGANVMGGPRRVEAAVGEGGLPEVTEAFQRVLKGQREWGKVGKTIADREGKLGDDEWVATQIFLRNSYMVGEDMRRVVRDAEPDKRTKGTDIAKEFQRLTLDLDKPTKTKDFKGFLEGQQKGANLLQSFFDLLSDVPDEL